MVIGFPTRKYKGKAWDQLGKTNSGRALRLSWNSKAWFAKNFRSVSAAARGSIGKGDGLVPGQEYNKDKEAIDQGSAEVAATESSWEPNRGSAEATGSQEGWRSAKKADAVPGGLA